MSTHHERERTWSPGADTELPDLTALPGVVGIGTPPPRHLVATYLDTPDLTLVRAGMSLRRRRGGADEGWHLKLPVGEGQDEVHRPLDGDHLAAPEDLCRIVSGYVRGRDLVPVAEIRTHRTAHDLRGPDGRVLAELADDRVEARALPAVAEQVEWREWELEIVDGDPALLAAADEVFARVGVRPSAVQHKVEVVLGDRLAAHLAVAAEHRDRAPTADGPARRVLHERLIQQGDAMLRHDAGMRRDAPGSLHHARVACRRLRAALATYRPLVDREVSDPLRAELRWVARSLGEARDGEVAHELLAGLVASQPDRLVRGPVRDRLEEAFSDAERRSRAETAEVLDSDRYLAALDALERLVAAPPWTPEAERPAADVLPPRVRQDWKRLRRRVDAAAEADEDARDAALHGARKAAKRLRYACEAAEPVWGRDAGRLRKAAREITQVLGERQDTTVSRQRLLSLAEQAEEAGESAFTWGRLHGLEEARAIERGRHFWDVTWPAAQRKKLRRWL